MDKRRWMGPKGDFLGIIHNFEHLPDTGQVFLEPRKELVTKMSKILESFVESDRCSPAEASKLRGLQGFLNTAWFGQLGRAGLRPFLERQYRHRPPWRLCDALRRAIRFYQAVLERPPQRWVTVRQRMRPPLIVASDAQVEPGSFPGAGFLIFDSENGSHAGGYFEFYEEELEFIGSSMAKIRDGQQPIARCECAVLPAAIHASWDLFRGRDVIWMVDNTVALSSIVKGCSSDQYLEAIVAHFWISSWRLDARIWVEYIDSKSNWADGISRWFDRDEFIRDKNVSVWRVEAPLSFMRRSAQDLFALGVKDTPGLEPYG